MKGGENVLRELCSMAVLLWLALQDKKHLGISQRGLVFASAVLLFAGCFSGAEWQSRLGGALMGLVILLFAYFSKQAIGYGDGVIVFACGVAFGLYETVAMVFFAAVFAGCYSGVLLVTKKAGRKSRIPFLPFLLLGYAVMRVLVCSV